MQHLGSGNEASPVVPEAGRVSHLSKLTSPPLSLSPSSTLPAPPLIPPRYHSHPARFQRLRFPQPPLYPHITAQGIRKGRLTIITMPPLHALRVPHHARLRRGAAVAATSSRMPVLDVLDAWGAEVVAAVDEHADSCRDASGHEDYGAGC